MVKLSALLLLLLSLETAHARCRQALVLGLDVSGSVDAQEYQTQIQGVAGALMHPDVRAALLVMPQTPVEIAIYEWSGQDDKTLILDWAVMNSEQSIQNAAATILAAKRSNGDPTTALGAAVAYGSALLDQKSECWTRTLDISGDGENNTGPRPRDTHTLLDRGGITLNALVITERGLGNESRESDLEKYFRAEVISGPNAFIEVANGFEDYQNAMVRKLLHELQGMVLSELDTGQ